MKRFLVIEADTEFNTVWVRDVSQDFANGTVRYEHDPGANFEIAEMLGPKFYGKLDALLITADKLENAAPIEIEAPAEKVTA